MPSPSMSSASVVIKSVSPVWTALGADKEDSTAIRSPALVAVASISAIFRAVSVSMDANSSSIVVSGSAVNAPKRLFNAPTTVLTTGSRTVPILVFKLSRLVSSRRTLLA